MAEPAAHRAGKAGDGGTNFWLHSAGGSHGCPRDGRDEDRGMECAPAALHSLQTVHQQGCRPR